MVAKAFKDAKNAKGPEEETEAEMAKRFQDNLAQGAKNLKSKAEKDQLKENREKENARLSKIKKDHEARQKADVTAAKAAAVAAAAAAKKAKEPLSPDELAARAERQQQNAELLKKMTNKPVSEVRAEKKAARRAMIAKAQAARCKVCRLLVADIWGRLAPTHSREEADFIDEATADDACATSSQYAESLSLLPAVAQLACKTTVDEHGEQIGEAMYNNRFQNVDVAVEQACYWLLKCQEGHDEL